MSPTFDDVHREKYLLLTTFTKDGRPKPTPVWGVPHGGKLLISTDAGSWKTKRIHHPALLVARLVVDPTGDDPRWRGQGACRDRG